MVSVFYCESRCIPEWILREPLFDLGMFMRRVIITDNMNVLPWLHALLNEF